MKQLIAAVVLLAGAWPHMAQAQASNAQPTRIEGVADETLPVERTAACDTDAAAACGAAARPARRIAAARSGAAAAVAEADGRQTRSRSRARILTSLGLAAGGASLLAIAASNERVLFGDRSIHRAYGSGALAASAIVFFSPRALAPPNPGEADEEEADEERGPASRWTGTGLFAGGALIVAASDRMAGTCTAIGAVQCRDSRRVIRRLGLTLAGSGLTLFVIDAIERRGQRVSVALAPRAVEVRVAF